MISKIILLQNKKYVRIVKELITRYFADDVGKSGAALAYYFIFSLFPFLIFLSTLLGYLEIPTLTITSELQAIIPKDIINIINLYIEHVTLQKNGNLLFFGLFFSIYFPMRAVNNLMQSINNAYRVQEERNFISHSIVVFIFTLFIIFSVIISLIMVTFGKTVLIFLSNFLNIPNSSIDVWNYLRFLILGAMLLITLSILYYVSPGYKLKFRTVLPGAIAALISWLVLSIGFAYYVENMANYSLIYGSIGAIIVLIMWLYFSAVIIIMGAELNHVLLTLSQKKHYKY